MPMNGSGAKVAEGKSMEVWEGGKGCWVEGRRVRGVFVGVCWGLLGCDFLDGCKLDDGWGWEG